MRACPRCARPFAEVVGAPEQACPHCGLVLRDDGEGSAFPGREARADPIAAAAFALRIFVTRYPRLAIMWLPAFVANFAASWAVLAFARAQHIAFDHLERLPFADALRVLGVAVPAFGASFVVELASWTLVARIVVGRGNGALPKPRWGAALAVGAMLAVAYTLGFVLFVVPFFVFFHWYMFAPAALASEERSASSAFEASRAFARERRTSGFTALVLLVWLAVGLVLSLGLEPLFEVPVRGAGDAAVAFADALAAWTLGPLVPLFPAAYWALAARASPGPQPGAAPTTSAERFATTKCPQCGMLIPYARTGAPVDVTCPTCGRTGRVL